MTLEQGESPIALEGATLGHKCLKVADELSALSEEVRSIIRGEAWISFHFEDRLRIFIDARDLNEVERLEALLPIAAGGVFTKLRRSLVDHHPFLHRLTAEVHT